MKCFPGHQESRLRFLPEPSGFSVKCTFNHSFISVTFMETKSMRLCFYSYCKSCIFPHVFIPKTHQLVVFCTWWCVTVHAGPQLSVLVAAACGGGSGTQALAVALAKRALWSKSRQLVVTERAVSARHCDPCDPRCVPQHSLGGFWGQVHRWLVKSLQELGGKLGADENLCRKLWINLCNRCTSCFDYFSLLLLNLPSGFKSRISGDGTRALYDQRVQRNAWCLIWMNKCVKR